MIQLHGIIATVQEKTIMNYLEQEVPTPSLYPEDCIEMVEKHVKIVDDTPHAGNHSILQEL